MTSDRWWAYGHLPLRRRQVCWSHLQRDFQAHAEGIGAEKEFGEPACASASECSGPGRSTSTPATATSSKRRDPACAASSNRSCASTPAKHPATSTCRGLARNLLKVWPALWTFADTRRRGADQQPRRTRTCAAPSSTASSPSAANPRPANTHRTAALRPHHLPPPTPHAPRLPRRTAHRQRPRRPRTPTRLGNQPLRGHGLNAYPSYGITSRYLLGHRGRSSAARLAKLAVMDAA